MKKQVTLILLITFCITGCGTNLFDSFIDDPEESITEQIENASTPAEYALLIEETQKIIDSDASDEEKGNAYLIQAEAILGKSEITPLDIIGKIATSIDTNDNPLNLLNTLASKEDLLDASNALYQANELGIPGDEDQQLMKGIVNTLVVVTTITNTFEINSDGSIKNEDSINYRESLETIMHPNSDDPNKDIFHYSEEAYKGFSESNSLTKEQEEKSNKIKSEAEKIEETYNDRNNLSDQEIEEKLTDIFKTFGN